MFPKLILNEIALHFDIITIMWLSENSKTFEHIFSSEYFWKLKLGKDYPQFPLKIDCNYFESYKRLYVGKAELFDLYKEDMKDIGVDNLLELTIFVKKKFNCVRGDLINFDYDQFIFDGKEVKKMYRHRDYRDYIPPRDLCIMNEFPIGYWNQCCTSAYFNPPSDIKEDQLKIIQMDDIVYKYLPVFINNIQYYILFDSYSGSADVLFKHIQEDPSGWNNNLDNFFTLPLPLTNDNTVIV